LRQQSSKRPLCTCPAAELSVRHPAHISLPFFPLSFSSSLLIVILIHRFIFHPQSYLPQVQLSQLECLCWTLCPRIRRDHPCSTAMRSSLSGIRTDSSPGAGSKTSPNARGSLVASLQTDRFEAVVPAPLVASSPACSGNLQVCMDRERDAILTPCYHFGLCADCASRVNRCPPCRTQIHVLPEVCITS
jgi:hypothetical protein